MKQQQALLAGKQVDYRLKRSRRRTIGLTINHHGLQVSAPFGLPLSEIHSVLQERADWIHQKLAIWRNKKSLNATGSETHKGMYPMLGKFWKPEISAVGQMQMIPVMSSDAALFPQPGQLLYSDVIRKWIAAWYQQQAIICFGERITLFSTKLGIVKPSFKLSNAKTRWGSCNSRGIIRLNWRLIQLPLNLIDYVIAHELCHLIEMNHSPAFWRLVSSIYPDYQRMRKELGAYTLQE